MPSNRRNPRKQSIWECQRGAIMVLGLFLACLLVGLLYYLSGLGQAILFRQRMQDAADSAAIAGAVVAARGMNLVVLLNNYMAVMQVLFLSLSVAQSTINQSLDLGRSRCPLPDTLACLNIPLLVQINSAVNDFVPDLQTRLRGQVAHASQVTQRLSATIPDAVLTKVVEMGAEQPHSPTEGVCLATPFASLPVERQDWEADPGCDGHVNPLIPGLVRPPVLNAPGIKGWVAISNFANDFISQQGAIIDHELCGHLRAMGPGAVQMGGDAFQIRAFVRGNPPLEEPLAGVKVALWGRSDSEPPLAPRLRRLGHVALAQAEFMYNADDPPEEWLWKMRWNVRLRRFSLPSGELQAPCAKNIGEFGHFNIHQTIVH